MTVLREAEHRALRKITLAGAVLDLGGDARSEYRSLFSGTFSVTTVNMLADAKPDIVADLEKPLPIPDASYDAVLLVNVLEHIFEYRALLLECARVLRPGGRILVVVPYLFPYHASPYDFHRFSADALERSLSASGFSASKIMPLGSGVMSAQFLLTERLLPSSIQSFLAFVTHPLVRVFDALVTGLARLFGKKYDPADYALGFVAEAGKPV